MLHALLALSARAAGWEAGLGTRNDLGEGGRAEGIRLLGRRDLGAWAFEAQLYGSPDTERYRDLDAVFAQIFSEGRPSGEVQLPIAVDRASAALLADWGVCARQPGGWDGGPRLYAGVEARYQQIYALGYDERPELDPQDTRLVVGPVAGAGLHLAAGDRLGARFLLADRMYVAAPLLSEPNEPSGSRSLRHSPTLALDLLVRL